MALKDNKRLQFIMDMVDKVSAPAAKVNKSLQAMGKDVTATQAKLKNLNKQAADLKAFKAMQEQMGKNNARTKELGDKVGQLKVQMAMVEKPTKAMRAALRDAEREQKAHVKTVHSHNTEMGKLEAALKKAKIPLDNIDRTEKNLTAAILRTNGALKSQQSELDKTTKQQERLTKAREAHDKAVAASGKMATTGAGMMAGGGALIAANYGASSTYFGLDSAMGRMQAKGGFDNARKKEIEAWVRNVAASSSYDASQVADMGTFLAGAGKAGSMEVIGADYVKLAEANNLAVENAGQFGTNIMASFKFDDSQTGEVFDKITRLSQISKTDIAQLDEGLKKLGPVAKGFNQSFDDMAISLAIFGNAGISGSEGATALASGLNNIIAGSKPAKDALKALKVQAVDSFGKMRAAPELLSEIFNATKDMTDDKKANYLRDIFGVDHLPKMMLLMGEMAKGGYDQLSQEYKDFAGSMDRAKAAQLNNFEGDMKILNSGIAELGNKYGETFDKMYRGIAKAAIKSVEWIDSWMKENPKLVKALGLAATGLGVIMSVVGALILAMAPLVLGWAKLRLAMWMWNAVAKGVLKSIWGLIAGVVMKTAKILLNVAAVTLMIARWTAVKVVMIAAKVAMVALRGIVAAVTAAQWLWNAALTANPIGAVIMAVVALVSAGIWLYKNWDKLPELFTELWGKVKEFVGFDPLGMISAAWDAVGDYFNNLFGGIWEKFTSIFGGIKDGITNLGGWALGGFGMFDDDPVSQEPIEKKLVQGNQIQQQKQVVYNDNAPVNVVINPPAGADAALIAKMVAEGIKEEKRKTAQQERARNKD